MEDELETLIIRSEELGSPRNDDLGPRRRRPCRHAPLHGAPAGHGPAHRFGPAPARRLRQRLRVGGGGRDPGRLGCLGHRALRRTPTAATSTSAAARPCPARWRPSWPSRVAMSASASTATPIAASPSMSAATVVDGDQLLGIIALDRIARGALAEDTVVVSILSNGGLARAVEQAGGRVLRTPVGDRHIVDSMLRLRRRPGRREERPRHHPRAHHHRRRHRHRARDPRHPRSQRAAALRAGGGHPARPAGAAHHPRPPQGVARRPQSWPRPSRPPRRSWPERAHRGACRPAPSRLCASWSRAATPHRVLRLADELAALAAERLNQDR